MKSAKMLTIWFVVLGLVVCSGDAASAVSLGTAITYQGRLIEDSNVADGEYDFQFKLYDGPADGNQVSGDVNIPDVDVIEGYFTVKLDFGSDVFDGSARWLGIGVRPGDLNDPNVYALLEPRQELTPVPYALQTRGIFVDDVLNVGIGTTDPGAKLHLESGGAEAIFGKNTASGGIGIHGLASDFSGGGFGVYGESYGTTGFGIFGIAAMTTGINYGVYGQSQSQTGYGVCGLANNAAGMNYGVYGKTNSSDGWAGYFHGRGYFSSNVGIGTKEPTRDLHIYRDAGPAQVGIVTADTSSKAQVIFGDVGGNKWTISSDNTDSNKLHFRSGHASGTRRVTFQQDGNVGIGDSTPTGKLQVAGDEVRIGNGGVVNYATGDGDLYVEDTLEVDGNAEVGGNAVVGGNAEVGGTVNADNMPGCEYVVTTGLANVPTGLTTITSVSLTLKASGYVIVTFSGFVSVGLAGDFIKAGIGSTETNEDNWQVCGTQTHGDDIPFSVQYVYSVSSAGTYTYYGLAHSWSGTSDILRTTITAIYVPNRY